MHACFNKVETTRSARNGTEQAVMGLSSASTEQANTPGNSVIFGVMTDLHTEIIRDGVRRLERFREACRNAQVDFAIQLGDFVQPHGTGSYTCPEEKISESMRDALAGQGMTDEQKDELLALYANTPYPTYHVIGNHDTDLYSKREIMDFWGMEHPFYSFDTCGFHFVVLDACYGIEQDAPFSFERGNYMTSCFTKNEPYPIVPADQLKWLQHDLASPDLPTVVFSHQGLCPGFLNALNTAKIFDILSAKPNQVILHAYGHKHQDLLEIHRGIPCYGLNSMSGYFVPPQFCATHDDTTTKEMSSNAPSMCAYTDPLFAIVRICDGAISIEGQASSFVSPTPEEMGVHFDEPSIKLTATVQSRTIPLGDAKSSEEMNRSLSDNAIKSEEILLSDIENNVIFSFLQDAICLFDSHGNIRFANKAACELFNKDPSSIVGTALRDAIPFTLANDKLIDLFIRIRTGGEIPDTAVDYERPDGAIRKLKVSMSLSRIKALRAEKYVLMVISDITDFLRVNKMFERYTSPAIARHVLDTPGGESLGGQTREVTILMSDLRGFTALSASLNAQSLVTMINHYFVVMSRVIERYQGIVIEFLGDGLFVVFNAPDDVADHATKATACAIEMQRSMTEVNTWNSAHGFPDLAMGVGINTGKAVVGNIGSEWKAKYGCIGESVNLAGRVESFTIGGQVYISEYTRSRISEDLEISGTHSFIPKGAKEKITIYSIEGIGGTYGVSCATEHDTLSPLPAALVAELHVLADKKVADDTVPVQITALSTTSALIQSPQHLERMENVMIEIGGDLYGKVIEQRAGDYLICFTAKPAAFGAWFDAAFAGQTDTIPAK